jgi:hypothetical protein
MRCPSCGVENPEGMKFCGECGPPLTGRCPQCGFANPSRFKFCGNCGAPLSFPAQVLSPAPVLPLSLGPRARGNSAAPVATGPRPPPSRSSPTMPLG